MFEGLSHGAVIWIIISLAVLAILFLVRGIAGIYRKAGPHEALIVYGVGGTRVVKGHGTIVMPMFQVCRGLSLELMSFDVAPQQDLYTKQGVAVTVEAVAQIKVKSDDESLVGERQRHQLPRLPGCQAGRRTHDPDREHKSHDLPR